MWGEEIRHWWVVRPYLSCNLVFRCVYVCLGCLRCCMAICNSPLFLFVEPARGTAPSYELSNCKCSTIAQRRAHRELAAGGNISSHVFGGMLRSDVVCTSCGNVSTTQDPFTHLSLDIPPREQLIPAPILPRPTTNHGGGSRAGGGSSKGGRNGTAGHKVGICQSDLITWVHVVLIANPAISRPKISAAGWFSNPSPPAYWAKGCPRCLS